MDAGLGALLLLAFVRLARGVRWRDGGRSARRQRDLAGVEGGRHPARSGLVAPVEVGVGDDLLRRRRPPRGQVLGRVRVADERRVVAADERAVERRADAGVGLRAGDDEPADAALGEHGSRSVSSNESP